MDTLKRLISATEVADTLGVPLHRVYEMTRTRQIPAVRVGRTCRYDPGKIAAWIDAGGTAGDDGRDAA